ncbi:MAG: preprotein translocase subunit SecE [Anaerolineae bacterium]
MAKAKASKKDNFIIKYFKDTRAELRKVSWPTRQEALNLTLIVVAFTISMAALLGIIDYIFAWVFGLIIR